MKLKYITLASFVLFVGAIVTLAFYNPLSGTSSALLNSGSTGIDGTVGTVPSVPKSTLTIETIATHNKPQDCYLIVKGAVYNVSTYINQHPGGVKNITSRCGQEATKTFSAIHSNFAWNLLKKYYVGDVGSASTTSATQATNTTANTSLSTKMPENFGNIDQVLKKEYPNSEIISIKPKKNFYEAKIISENKLLEVQISEDGEILKEEVENDEEDWNAWDDDESEEESEDEYEDD